MVGLLDVDVNYTASSRLVDLLGSILTDRHIALVEKRGPAAAPDIKKNAHHCLHRNVHSYSETGPSLGQGLREVERSERRSIFHAP